MADVNESGNAPAETMSADDEAYFASGGTTDVAEPEIVEDEEIASPDEPVIEAAEEETAPEPEQPGQQKTVPHKALHAEREEHKRTKSELTEARERLARLDERTNMILAQLNQRQQPEQEQEANPLDQMPDATVDPVGAIAWVTQQFAAQKQAEQEQARQYQEQQQEAYQAQQIVNEADVVLTQAIAQDASVQEAFEFTSNVVKAEIARMGYHGQQAEQIYQQELVKFAANAPRDPQGIADRAKAVARYYGWTPQAANQQSATDKITQLQKAVPANRSLSQASGKSTNLSAADIDSMSDGEFSDWLSKGGEAAWKKANGL